MRNVSKSRNMTDKLPTVHPGEILKETLDDLGMSMKRLSKEIQRAREPHQFDYRRATRDHRRDRPSPRDISGPRRNTGLRCKHDTTWKPPAISGRLV